MAQPPLAYADVSLGSETDFRLLILHARSRAEEITCSLISADLNDKPHYEALSYCWGSPRNTQLIILGAHRFEIRENLYSALWSLRREGEDRVLWVDALCINQANVAERSHQVSIMGPIYSKSERVLVWLGPESEDSDIAMDMLSGANTRHLSRNEKRQALDRLCHREYWQRMWIIQEFCLAPAIVFHCGSRSGDFSAFWRLTGGIEYKDSPSRAVLCARNRCVKSGRRTAHLLSLIDDFIDRKCADPRDKVYALVAMAADYQQTTLAIDYEKKMLEVYCDVFDLYTSGPVHPRNKKNHRAPTNAFVYGTTQTFPSILFSQILRWSLEASINDAKEDGRDNAHISPWKSSKASKRSENRSFSENFKFDMDSDDAAYREAQLSLAKLLSPSSSVLGVLDNKFKAKELLAWQELDKALDWVETKDNTRPRTIRDAYEQWPLKFPIDLRHLSRLQLFLEVFGKFGVLDTIALYDSIEVSIFERSSLAGPPVKIGNINVLRKNGYFTVQRFDVGREWFRE